MNMTNNTEKTEELSVEQLLDKINRQDRLIEDQKYLIKNIKDFLYTLLVVFGDNNCKVKKRIEWLEREESILNDRVLK